MNAYFSKSLFKLIIFVFIGFPSAVFSANEFNFTKEEDCTDDSVAVASKIKMQDQDGLLMCGAYSTSVLINAEILTKNPNSTHQTSGLFLGAQYASKNNFPTLEISSVTDLAKQARTLRSCPSTTIGDYFGNQKNGQFVSTLYKGFSTKNSESIRQCIINAGIASENASSLSDLGNYLTINNFPTFVTNIFSDICKNQSQSLDWLPELKTLTARSFGNNRIKAMDELKKTLNKNIKNQKITGINYCALVLQNPTANGIDANGSYSEQCKVGSESAAHSSTVVARRKLKYRDGNKEKFICQYLVRDVYGASCAKYPDDPTGDPKERCKQGAVWVDEDALLSNTLGVFNF